MRYRLAALLMTVLAGCSGGAGQSYSIFFQPYVVVLDQRAQDTIHDVATYAAAHPLAPVTIASYYSQAGYGGVQDGMSEQRAEAVRAALIQQGVAGPRIEILGDGSVLIPENLPDMPLRRVDVKIGL